MKVDIHNYDKHLEYFLKKLDKLNSPNKDFILNFVDRLFAEGLSKGRIGKYVYCLINIAKFLNKPFS